MRIGAKHYLAGFAVILLSLPLWAQTFSTDLMIDQPTTIAGTELKPGDYQLKVKSDATQVTVEKDGAVVAEVPCHWIQLSNKPDDTEVSTNDNHQITEIEFGGRTEAVQIP
jgi:hypothetical protein